LVTNRPVWEGGQWAVGEEERIDLLCQALDWGAHYVDIELRAAPELRAQVVASARRHQAETIISHHDFERTRTSEHLTRLLEQMMGSGAAIGKIVTTAQTPTDALRVLALQEQAKAARFPLIAFAMGSAGTISRLATLYLGGVMSYAALSPEQATAPGQLSIHALQHLISTLEEQP
jgi:3-dehydroquinate dehydratase type I